MFKQKTLFQYLLSITPAGLFGLSRELGSVSPATLSRLSTGAIRSKRTLARVAAWYSKQLQQKITESQLMQPISGNMLAACAKVCSEGANSNA